LIVREEPFQYVVDEKKAALADAEQQVDQLKASLDQATAAAGRADAQLQLAQQNYDRQNELFEKNVIAKATLDTYTRNLDAAKQTLAAAKAEQERVRLAYTFGSIRKRTSPSLSGVFDRTGTSMTRPFTVGNIGVSGK
jgi:multidrug resistance efflux pump